MPFDETFDALRSSEFLTGAAFGTVALVVGALAIIAWQQWRSGPAPIAGLLMVGGSIGAIQRTLEVPSGVLAGISLLAVGGAVYPWSRRVPLLPAALAIPGAWWLTHVVDIPGARWVPWWLMIWIVAAATLVSHFDRRLEPHGLAPLLLVISIAAIFSTLPDTEHILVVFGVTLPLGLFAWARGSVSAGAVGVYPLVGLLAWITAVGGQGRESSIVGAAACLGLLAVEPIALGWRRNSSIDRILYRWWTIPIVVSVHALLAFGAARLAGTAESVAVAAAIAIVVLAAPVALLIVSADR